MPAAHKADGLQCRAAFFYGFRRRVMTIVAIVAVAVAVIAWSFIPTSRSILPIIAPIPVIAAWSAIHAQLLNSVSRFYLPAMAPGIAGFCAIAAAVFLPKSTASLSVALLIFDSVAAVFLWYSAKRLFAFDRVQDRAAPLVQTALRVALVQSVGSAISALNPLVAMMFAKSFGPGAVTIADYANRFWSGVPLLFSGALIVFYAEASRRVASGTFTAAIVKRTSIQLAFPALALTVLLFLLAPSVIGTLYAHGNLAGASSHLLSEVFLGYVLGTVPYVIALVSVRAISALGRADLLVFGACIVVLTNIAGTAVAVRFVGLPGIGVAWALAQAALAAFFWFWFRSKKSINA